MTDTHPSPAPRRTRLDPRTHLGLLLAAVVALAATTEVSRLAAGLAAVLIAAGLGGALPAVARALRLAMPAAVLVFVLGGSAGWDTALAAVLRLMAIVAVAALVFRAVPPEDLGNALVAGGVPYQAAFVVITAAHFVPVILRRAQSVRDAARARGIALDAGWRSARHVPTLVLPVFYQSFRLADDLAEALETRGFRRPGRTFERRYRLGAVDWALLAAGTALAAAYVTWTRAA